LSNIGCTPVKLITPADACSWLRGRSLGRLHTDSRKVSQGDGFIAWPGAATDGRQYVQSALAAGAHACLIEAKGSEKFNIQDPRVAILEGLKAASGLIAAAYYAEPSAGLDIVAITGTNGKTTTAWLLSQAIANVRGSPCGVVGTLGIGLATEGQAPQVQHNGLTTPDPVLFQESLAQMKEQGATACVLEASSIGIAEHRLDGTRIRVAVFTNFSQDHLDYHSSMQAYWACKEALFAWQGLSAAVVNVDDANGKQLAHSLSAGLVEVWTVSLGQNARLCAQAVSFENGGASFDVVEGDSRVRLQTQLIGDYNVSNLLCAIASMRAMGISLHQATLACSALLPVPGRMDSIALAHAPMVVVDYAHTPDALAKALQALRPVARQRAGRLWCVFGCGGNRDASKRPLMGRVAQEHADLQVITSDNPRDEVAQDITAQIMNAMQPSKQVFLQVDRAAAIAFAVSEALPQDVILVAGKGHEDYQEVAGKKMPFSDAANARSALALKGYAA
jgi:UDP-N-acetylmuramyl-tripeptide synthetase